MEMTTYEYLTTYEYFTEEEIQLVIYGWGDNSETYRIACRVRYEMDPDQLAEEDGITLTDYAN